MDSHSGCAKASRCWKSACLWGEEPYLLCWFLGWSHEASWGVGETQILCPICDQLNLTSLGRSDQEVWGTCRQLWPKTCWLVTLKVPTLILLLDIWPFTFEAEKLKSACLLDTGFCWSLPVALMVWWESDRQFIMICLHPPTTPTHTWNGCWSAGSTLF